MLILLSFKRQHSLILPLLDSYIMGVGVNKLIAILTIVLVVSAIGCVKQSTGQVTGRKEVKVGSTLALSSDYGVFGTAMQ